MNTQSSLFFCAIGGSGMLPLALIAKSRGYNVSGSDRAHDQGRTPERFAAIQRQGIALFPQDGTGITQEIAQVIVSTAVEQSVPDVVAALSHDIPVKTRAQLLASFFNDARTSVGVAGTSGKTTTTGMIAWIAHKSGAAPTVFNGGVMKNFVTSETPIATALIGNPDFFISEIDESDGSIAHFKPGVAVLNNIAIDHKSMDELRALFGAYVDQAGTVVLNLDNPETAKLAVTVADDHLFTYSLRDSSASLFASSVRLDDFGSTCDVAIKGQSAPLRLTLRVPGLHNVSNALAAIGAAMALGLNPEHAAYALETFIGINRRLDIISHCSNGITVIDDFAHNPDKITATLRTLHEGRGRLLILFQPHGFGPLRLMRNEFAACFATEMRECDVLHICDPLYLGGTTDRSVSSLDLANDVCAKGRLVCYASSRADCAKAIVNAAKTGDTILVMGARDDTLSTLAGEIARALG